MITVLLVILILPIIALFAPIWFSARIRFPEQTEFQVRIWGGFLQWQTNPQETSASIAGFTYSPKKKKEGPSAPAQSPLPSASKIESARKNLGTFLAVLNQGELIRLWGRALKKSMRFFLRSIRFNALFLDAVVGLETPAKTGILMGSWHALEASFAAYAPPGLTLRLQPDFATNRFIGEARIEGRTALWRLLRPVIVLFFYAPLLRTQRVLRSFDP